MRWDIDTPERSAGLCWIDLWRVGFNLCIICSVCGSVQQIASLRVQAGQLGQEETVQKCLQNGAWVEGLLDRFGELINQVQQACQWSSLDFGFKGKNKVQHRTRECLQLRIAREEWSESLCSHRKICIRELSAHLSEGRSEACGLKTGERRQQKCLLSAITKS